MSAREVLFDLPGAQGWAMLCWAIECNEWSSPDRVGPGYVGQEVERLKSMKSEVRSPKSGRGRI